MALNTWPRLLLQILICITILHISLASAQQSGYLYHFCGSTGNYTNTSTYKTNLNTLLSSLSSNINPPGLFLNASVGRYPDTANGIAFCRGDTQLQTCKSCVRNATINVLQVCPNQVEAVLWFEECMVRYSNTSILGRMVTGPAFYMRNTQTVNNSTEFNQDLRTLLDDLRGQAAYENPVRKFAVGNRSALNLQTIYGLVQCTPDISADDCSSCLIDATSGVGSCCSGQRGARYYGPSCGVRFETYSFFNQTATELPPPRPPPSPPPPPSPAPPPQPTPPPPGKGNNTGRTVIVIVVPVVAVGILLVSMCFIWRRRLRRRPRVALEDGVEISTAESLQFDFSTIRDATNNFSDANMLGQGGFGAVFKGKLSSGQEIAVKRLAKDSGQGELEFKNEVLLLARLQHRNLVRLLGFSLEGTERLLMYEFVPNSSLDHVLFNSAQRGKLDWERRYKIIGGVAKGLVYLHEDSRLRIIHRDLKASNVLLDVDMNPKIADFGMARLFTMDETQGNTSRIVGTYGYMAPEYAMHGQFSVKSDVYSFGVLVLEVISGQRSTCFRNGDSVEDLTSYAWKNWREGSASNVIDPVLRNSSGSVQDMVRCVHIGLLCVQADVAARPTMASVVLMLNSFSLTLPVPLEPAFCPRSAVDPESSIIQECTSTSTSGSKQLPSSKSAGHSSVNEASMTDLYPR